MAAGKTLQQHTNVTVGTPSPSLRTHTSRRGNPPQMMPDAALAPDHRFGEVEGGKDIYPDEKGVWLLCDEGEMTVSNHRRRRRIQPLI